MSRRSTNKVTLIVFGVIAVVIAIVGVVSVVADRSKDTPRDTSTNTQQSDTQPAQQETKSVEVTSTIVKKMPDGTYDYWFSIKNVGDTAFSGDVAIKIWNNDKTAYAGESGTFSNLAIDAGMAKAVNVNIKGAPSEYGYFSYTQNDTKQPLTEKYEDASASL